MGRVETMLHRAHLKLAFLRIWSSQPESLGFSNICPVNLIAQIKALHTLLHLLPLKLQNRSENFHQTASTPQVASYGAIFLIDFSQYLNALFGRKFPSKPATVKGGKGEESNSLCWVTPSFAEACILSLLGNKFSSKWGNWIKLITHTPTRTYAENTSINQCKILPNWIAKFVVLAQSESGRKEIHKVK